MRTDAELVNAVLDGEKQAFASLVKRYELTVRTIALNVRGDFHSAADVTQDVFVKAYEQLWTLRKPEAFGSWIMKIAHRCALDSAQRKPKEAPLETNVATAIENPNSQSLDFARDRLDEAKQELLAAVVKLPKSEKQVVMLRYFGSHSVKDVAEMVGRSIGTVTKQLSRARIRLRKMLKEKTQMDTD